MTVQEYLSRERLVATRHEFVGGEMVERSGCSPRHSIITANVSSHIHNRTDCATFSPMVKVFVSPRQLVAYPDVTVVCGRPEYLDDERNVITNPKLLVVRSLLRRGPL